MNAWPIPSPDELEPLPVREKPNYVGFVARAVGIFVALGNLLRIRAARRFNERFYTVLGGVLYTPVGVDPSSVGKSIADHEAVHGWQAQTFRFYKTRYVLSRRARRHFEAAAYAYEIHHHGRDRHNAIRSFSDPIYAMGLSTVEAAAFIDLYTNAYEAKHGPKD